jgi:hypothetical protein
MPEPAGVGSKIQGGPAEAPGRIEQIPENFTESHNGPAAPLIL